MATFPRTESDIVALAQEMKSGLQDNAAVYPNPPYSPDSINARTWAFINARDAAVAASAAAEEATAKKQEELQELIDAMKSDLTYAENTVDGDDDKLKLIGWSGRKAPTKLTVPGQPRNLEIENEGPGTITLDWKKPAAKSGGKPQSYIIQCRQLPDGASPTAWELKGMALDTEAALAGLPQGTRLEFRVLAVNKAGQSEPSNTVDAVL
jgi:hypothetical protein